MDESRPYAHFEPNEMLLRDHLAIDRTVLANERTLLAYIRTGFAFVVVGLTFLQFVENVWFDAIGVLLIGAGGITLLVGGSRFREMKRRIDSLGGTGRDSKVRT